MNISRSFILVVGSITILLLTSLARAQRPWLPEGDPARTWKESDSRDDRWNKMQIGPFLASVLPTPGGAIAKGLSIKVGDGQQATVGYDTSGCAMRVGWTGGFLKFNPRRYGITSSPQIDGDVQIVLSDVGWGEGKLPYRGLYQQGQRVVLAYTVDGAEVLESPWAQVSKDGNVVAFVRNFEIGPHDQPLSLALLANPGERTVLEENRHARYTSDGTAVSIAVSPEVPGVNLQHNRDSVTLRIDPNRQPVRFRLSMCSTSEEQAAAADKLLSRTAAAADLRRLIKPGNTLWPDWIKTGGKLGEGEGPYVIDTVNVPFDNPYQALLFTSGLGFLSHGDVAVSTMHGDVWLVRGVDDDLSGARWKRYATGLCQPLGLTVVDDQIYVLGKDQITRLHDRNGDDEADFYECFNNDGQTSLGGHDFASCLETDPEGNFYYIRAHEGVCRVSADGKTHESIATGFRNPIGLGVGPDGTVTAAPQEGNWTPSSCLFKVQKGGYYGFAGPRKSSDRPLGYDPPLCWMPRSADNSSGGQVWVTSDNWGLPKGQMLHLSYGLCTALVVMDEEVDGVAQGGVVKLPLFFESGVMRGRFSARDGQLYVCGLKGWQTAAAKDGCLQRVRYTGGPVHVPVGLQVKPQGIAITFNEPLDAKSAGNPDNYYIEQWNYLYSKEYGSKDYRPSDPKKFGRDEVFIDDVQITDGGRTVYLELETIEPVMQMGITYQIQAADGKQLKSTIYNTINVVPN